MYNKFQLSTANTGLILILIDQSGSMELPYTGTQTRAEFAALAINRCVFEIIAACTSGDKIKDRCSLGIIGYGGDKAQVMVGGSISEVHGKQLAKQTLRRKIPDGAGGLIDVDVQMPVWIGPVTGGGTPMAEGLKEAREIAQLWVDENPNNFPPLVINITDGEPSDASAAANEAQALLQIRTSDGNLMLLNAHIANGGGVELILPNSEPADGYARFLYSISSELPPPLHSAARLAGLSPGVGAKGCVFNANADTLVRLLTFGSNPAATR